jgi:hypothetical protein
LNILVFKTKTNFNIIKGYPEYGALFPAKNFLVYFQQDGAPFMPYPLYSIWPLVMAISSNPSQFYSRMLGLLIVE